MLVAAMEAAATAAAAAQCSSELAGDPDELESLHPECKSVHAKQATLVRKSAGRAKSP